MRYLSLFSGIGGFDLGFDRAGMECVGQVEIDDKARSVLKRHWPDILRMSDIREVQGNEFGTVDVIAGGFPCQDVSVAGRRTGLAGERSGLWFEFHRVINRVKPRIVVIENVPGLLSSNGGRDFAVILRGLVECGYGVSWRILDAQYFGVAQRRRRVFIVGYFGGGRSAEILFESEGGGWDSPESRKARQVAPPVTGKWAKGTGDPSGDECQNLIIHSLTAEGHDASEDGSGRGVPLVASTLNSGGNNGGFRTEPGEHLIIARETGADWWQEGGDVAGTMHFGVRRLTPLECERLQGFPDGWTDGQSDSARYRQLGNAVSVPVAEWIAKRITGGVE